MKKEAEKTFMEKVREAQAKAAEEARKAAEENKETNKQNELNSEEGIVSLEIDKLISFQNQPFKPYSNDEMNDLKQSIENIGLQTPIIVRKKDESYEILAGHNRVEAYKELGRDKIEARVVDADDDVAQMIMIDTNIVQRESLSPMERAKAYKLKQEIARRKGYSLTEVSKGVLNEKESEELKNIEESKNTYYRYLALNDLIPEYQTMCDQEEMPIKTGEQLSKLNKTQQKTILKALGNTKISEGKAKELRELAVNSKEFTEDIIKESFSGNKNTVKTSVKFTKKEMEKYFSDLQSNEDIKERVIEALDKTFSEGN